MAHRTKPASRIRRHGPGYTVRDTFTPERHNQIARRAADALLDTWPRTESNTALAQALRANATTLTHHAGNALYSPTAHDVLVQLGDSLGEAGRIDAAISHFSNLVRTIKNRLDTDHLDALTARLHLAHWRAAAGDVTAAVEEFTQVLQDCQRILEPDHVQTLNTRNFLAQWRAQTDTTAVVAELAELVPDFERVLGPDHLDTLDIRATLAQWRAQVGDVTVAVAEFAQLVQDYERVLGPDHPQTLSSRENLTYWQTVSPVKRAALGAAMDARAAHQMAFQEHRQREEQRRAARRTHRRWWQWS